jgi:hypothetical protein
MKFILFLTIVIISSCVANSNLKNLEKNKEIYIYRITHGELGYENLTGIAYVKDKLYSLPKDSLLMTYISLPPKSKEIFNVDLLKMIRNLNITELEKMKNTSTSECKGLTKNEYIIKYIHGNEKKSFVFTEVLKCRPLSSYIFLENLRSYFLENDKHEKI